MHDTTEGRPARPAVRRAAAARRWLPALAVVGLLGLAAAATALSSPRATRLPIPELSPREFPVGSGPPPSVDPYAAGDRRTGLTIPDWFAKSALVLLATIAVAVIAVLVWTVLREHMSLRRGTLPTERGATAAHQRTDEVVAALDAGLAELSDVDADPRRAVIACWVRLEYAAAAAGTPRHIGDTSTDLVLRLLGEHRVDRGVLDRFAAIYRAARYATHAVDEQMRTGAVSALRQLRGELTASASAGSAPAP